MGSFSFFILNILLLIELGESLSQIDSVKYRLGEKYVVKSKTRLFMDVCVVVTATATTIMNKSKINEDEYMQKIFLYANKTATYEYKSSL
ncbi:hypothetical protein HZS_6248 [Henneguya salminicola]|nr:hypothetical protein HZS_6248 [Henneguya salminicola]